MDIKNFKSGSLKKGFQYDYFLPKKINHSFSWNNSKVSQLLEKASLKLGELNSFSKFVPDTDMFIKMHILKEAVVSSKIEGTQTNIEDALFDESELEPEKRNDWQEVNNYVSAINYAIDELINLPLSNRLIKNTHEILLSHGRGKLKTPGEFRTSQNWIGGASLIDATFIPPAHEELAELLSDLEAFIHNDKIPHLIKISIIHYQFETIHPFLDGNGRVGRLLITLYLVSNKIMDKPLLYLSDFFERNRLSYYDKLTLVRSDNDLEQWIIFFLVGIIETAEKSVKTLNNIIDLKTNIEDNIISSMGRRSKNGILLLQELFKEPLVTVKKVQQITGLSAKPANELVKTFVEHKILSEMTGYQRNRVFLFGQYLELFHSQD